MMGKHPRISVLAALLAVCLLAACGDRPSATAFRTLPPDGWESADSLRFDIDSLKATADYVLVLSLRTSVASPYPYRTISLVLCREWPDTVATDTLELPVVTAAGEDDGRGVSLRQHDFPVDTLRLSAGSCGHISVRHIMRRTPLPGIRDVGIRLSALSTGD